MLILYIYNVKEQQIQECLKLAISVKPFHLSKLKWLLGTEGFIFNKLPLEVNYYYNQNERKDI